jgi:hypothetical protein
MVCIWSCSVWSLSGHYLVTTWSLSGLFLGPTWTLPGLTGTNMIPILSSCCPYVIPTYSACSIHGPYPVMSRLVPTWSLSVCYLVCTWSLSGPIWSLCSPNFVCMFTIRSLRGPYTPLQPAWSQHGPYLVLVPTWSIPDQYLVHTLSICGLYVVPSWFCIVLTWFLCVPYMLLHGLCGLYMVPT